MINAIPNSAPKARIDVLAATVDIETLNIKDIGHISTGQYRSHSKT